MHCPLVTVHTGLELLPVDSLFEEKPFVGVLAGGPLVEVEESSELQARKDLGEDQG